MKRAANTESDCDEELYFQTMHADPCTPISLLEKKSFPTIPLLGAFGGLCRLFLLD